MIKRKINRPTYLKFGKNTYYQALNGYSMFDKERCFKS